MLRLLADENLNAHIVRGLHRRLAGPDALRSLDPEAREMLRQLLGKLKKRLVRLRS